MKSGLYLTGAVAALAGAAVAEDRLVSQRLSKRFVDDEGHYNMTFFHVNDVHAHLDEFASSGTNCTDPSRGCYGGYSRIKSTMDDLREEHPDNLWLNAGDEFQGTLFYTYYGGEKIAETVNALKFDAMTLGNHEFDGGDEELGEFLQNLTFPVVSTNIKSDYEPLNKTIKPYVIFEEHQVAVIGATTEDTPGIANVGNQTRFIEAIPEIQNNIYEIRNETNITRIVVLSHLGYDVDQELAEKTEGISLIIGGHSHTKLGSMDDAEGKYPTIAEDLSGQEVFIVTAWRWGEFLGHIDLTFGDDGRALAYSGAPIHMTNTTEQDEDLQEKIDEWAVPFEEFAGEKVGFTENELDQTTCQDGDCLLGQVMADAMLEYRANLTTSGDEKPDFALINAGGVRATIEKGDISRGSVLTSFPFGNAIVEIKMKGEDVRKVLEGCVSMENQFNNDEITSWFQVSDGIYIEYNEDNDKGERLVNATIGGEALDDNEEYRIVTLDFLAGGGDNIFETTSDFATLDTQDEVLMQYLEAHNPLTSDLEERVVKTDGQASDNEDEDESSGGSGGDDSGNGDDSEGSGSDGGDDGDAAGMLSVPAWGSLVALAAVFFAL
ncbi:Metallo-dependent phosphatase [Sarocladium strictum]